jgi:prepilin-type N-terminal cleavage/methylation domain-containing protein
MRKQDKHGQNGFTIIEVVLVLAIAGLIFLIVFLAVPALQRSQRDTQRRQDMSRFMAQIQHFQNSNDGNVPVDNPAGPGSVGRFVDDYLLTAGDTWSDPGTGNEYGYVGTGPGVGEYEYQVNARCDGESIVAGGGSRRVAVRTDLEGSGYYCLGN